MNHQVSLTAYLAAFVAELVQTGVTDVVVSPVLGQPQWRW